MESDVQDVSGSVEWTNYSYTTTVDTVTTGDTETYVYMERRRRRGWCRITLDAG